MEATTYVAHDDMPNIFAGVGILPVQYGESRRRKLPSEGERKLLFAVLEDAIRTYLRHRDSGAEARNRMVSTLALTERTSIGGVGCEPFVMIRNGIGP